MPNDNRFMAGIAYGTATVLIWAAFPILTKMSVEQALTPNDISVLRYGTAGLLLLPVLMRKGLQDLPITALVVLVCGAGLPYLLAVTHGLTLSSASHFGLVTPSTMLLCTALGGWLFHREALTLNRLLGLACVVAGLGLVALDGLLSPVASLKGDLLFMLGGFLWASYTLALRQWHIEPLHATALVSSLSMILCIPLMLLTADSQLSQASSREIAVQMGYQGVLSAILALILYSRAVGILGPSKGSVFGALVPGVAMLLAVIFLDETASVYQLAGVAIIFIGVMVTLEFIKPVSHKPAPASVQKDLS
jgi:drug/metabolite transporter (DMT)-like permease